MDYQSLCHKVIEVVKEAGAYIQSESKEFNRNKDVGYKGRNDLVTYVDKASEEKLISSLQALLPESGVMAEEDHQDFQHDKNLNWIIDPLDGTLNFVHQIPCYCVSVALTEGEEVKLGVVYELNQDECFYAYKGGGAYLNDDPIRVSNTTAMEDALFATGFPFMEPEIVKFYTGILNHLLANTRGVRRIGSAAVDLCYTAMGRFDGYYEFNLKAWDVAAGALIVTEAGGDVFDFRGGENYLFDGEIIAGNPAISNAFYQLFKKHS